MLGVQYSVFAALPLPEIGIMDYIFNAVGTVNKRPAVRPAFVFQGYPVTSVGLCLEAEVVKIVEMFQNDGNFLSQVYLGGEARNVSVHILSWHSQDGGQ